MAPIAVLISFFIFFLLLLLIWTLGGSVRCSNVGLRLYRHPSSDEGSLWSCLLCSRSLSFCFSFGPREVSPVFQCGSLSLSPSIARGRFYGDKQNIHQYGYGPRPFQAPSLLGNIPKRCPNILQKHFFNYVHSSTICNSQNLETA